MALLQVVREGSFTRGFAGFGGFAGRRRFSSGGLVGLGSGDSVFEHGPYECGTERGFRCGDDHLGFYLWGWSPGHDGGGI